MEQTENKKKKKNLNKMEIVPERLHKAMKEQGLNGTGLAEKANVSRSAMSLFLNGNRQPSRMVLATMAEILSVSVDFLLGHGEASVMKEGQENPRIVKLVRDFNALTDQDQQRVMDLIDSLKQTGPTEENIPEPANDARLKGSD